MVFKSILSLSDRLSANSILTNPTSSNIGVLGTLIWIIVSFVIFLPPVILYFQGNYFQSEFLSFAIPRGTYYSGQDFKIAISFRNKLDNSYPNHTQILDKIIFQAGLYTAQESFITDMQLCEQGQFQANSINPTKVDQCIKLPSGLIYNIQILFNAYSTWAFSFIAQCNDPFKCKDNSEYKALKTKYFIDLMADNYYQIIFTSTILDQFGEQKFQIHKAYSTQYDQQNGFLPFIRFYYWQRQSFIDDSILPWKNNITHSNMIYSGKTRGFSLTQEQAEAFGGAFQTFVQNRQYTAYRFYKKLDFIIGMLGGGIFLLFLFFWLPCSYINRTLQKIRNAQELLVQKQTLIINQKSLKPISIPLLFILKNLIPGKSKQKDIIQDAEKQIDIIKLIKKIKVAHRNLTTNAINDGFVTKDIQFIEDIPSPFLPDREGLKTLNLTLNSYQAVKQSPQTLKNYQNNLTVMTMIESPKVTQLCADDVYDKNSQHKRQISLKSTIKQCVMQVIKFFDIFGAKPMFIAEPYSSSCWGFFLTCLIIVLSVLTFCLTIYNMETLQMFVSYTYQSPQDCNYNLVTGKNYKIAVCFNKAALSFLQGPNKAAKISYYSNSTKYGYQQLDYIQMGANQYGYYFQSDENDPFNGLDMSPCFKIMDDINIPFGGSSRTPNEAYFGFKISPYCFGTPTYCASIKNTTLQKYTTFINQYGFTVFMSQNQYVPAQNRIISRANRLFTSNSPFIENATIYRQENYYLDKIQLLDDRSNGLVRQSPVVLQERINYTPLGDKNLEQYGYPNMDPDYVLKLRPSGKKKSVILRNYKIDQLFGIMGGVFVFWYFFVHFFGKRFNHFKFRTKLAQILYRQDAFDESYFVQFLHLANIPMFCCGQSALAQDVRRVRLTEKKIINDLNYLELVKYVDNCYRLSSSFFNNLEAKDLSLIYLKQKIDESQKVYLQVKTKKDQIIFQDDQFLQFDEDEDQDMRSRKGIINQQMIPQQSSHNLPDLDKYLNRPASEKVTIYDHEFPLKQENSCLSFLKKLDLFKNSAQLTLDGERDVKSLLGGIFFFILLILIILVAQYFVGIYVRGDDYTVSYQRYVDSIVNLFDQNDQIGQITKGLTFKTGQNFKFAVSFYKMTHYYPFNVSTYFGTAGPIGLRIVNVTTTKINGKIQRTQSSIQLVPCTLDYVKGWVGQYTSQQFYDFRFANAFCFPNGLTYTIKGFPQDTATHYFKINLYNKYKNSTGRTALNQFASVYLTRYYMSVPRQNIFDQEFTYEMYSFSMAFGQQDYAVQRNLTFSKLIFTDKYYQRSRQSYNDQTQRNAEKEDLSSISDEYSQNLTFYYSNIVDRYTLDYPGGAQLFGIVGGIIVFFIFGFGCIIGSYNNYRMKYLIGKKLYRFDKTSTGVYKDSKKKKTTLKKIESAIKQINNYNELQIFWAWLLNPIAYIRGNYNFDKTLRRITLIQQRVDKDLNLFDFYSTLNGIRDAINKKLKLSRNPDIKICSIYPKHIFHEEKVQVTVSSLDKQTKKHNFSAFQQIKISKAIEKHLNPSLILGGNKALNRPFGFQQGTSMSGAMNESLGVSIMERTGYDGLNNSHTKMNSNQQERQYRQERQQVKSFDQNFQIQQQN